MALEVTPSIAIDDDELVERFVRASGAGGQNVNKVSTAVELRFDVAASPNLTAPVKSRLRALAGRRMTAEGVIVIRSEATRSQAMNRENARDRLAALIRQAAAPPPPKRIATKPTFASKKRRLEGKTRRGAVKAKRGRVRDDD